MTHVLALDQGTTSSRAILFDGQMTQVAVGQQEFPQHFPAPGWVEHDPEDIWSTTLDMTREALDKGGVEAGGVAGIGITNQRETTLVWEKSNGQAIHNAIVWQDRRTSDLCAKLRDEGHEAAVTAATGLLLDPYFSGTKLKWILDQVPGARDRARRGELAFGTVDTFLIWRLTGGAEHVTDATNAARTLLYDIHKGEWSKEICALLDVPIEMLPKVKDCAADFGTTDPSVFGASVPILGVAGDQQAATLGQACFEPGMLKSTYGTGCFALLNTGDKPVTSKSRLLTTIGYQLDGQPTYALEGSIFVAGAVVQWLRDAMKVINAAPESGVLAASADPDQPVIVVPAFTGLGAPYWNPECRGAVLGLTRNSGAAELTRASLESVAYQTRDLLEAMHTDWGEAGEATLRVDGGMSGSDWTMQCLSDILGAPVDRPVMQETTALGVAWLAGMRAGVYPDAAGFAKSWALDRRFEPAMSREEVETRYARWKRAVVAAQAY
ncbi:MAG: glycerol kinase GlpK [Pseudomonadota bacterium]